jgi:mono/diheme cytochrome c family protein
MSRSLLVAAALTLAACHDPASPVFHEPLKLGGTLVPVASLERGRIVYIQYCRACHGDEGKGNGPASVGLRPPPRNLSRGIFKFGATLPRDGSPTLPRDEDLVRIIRGGLHGSAMLAWDIPEPELHDVIQYLKTFSTRWRDEEAGEPLVPSSDPYATQDPEAVTLGKALYHGLAQCSSCHPAYATRVEILAASKRFNPAATPVLRDDLYHPSPVDSQEYSVDGVHPLRILPPDFLHRPLKSVRPEQALGDLYRVISLGITGAGMPPWRETLTEDQIWAIAHYVNGLQALRETPEAAALEKRTAEANRTSR